ncbi:MAG: glycosyltransferase [Planctomycetes bacterium]|nr:glycosyltransferase [Planctomycetota bacterium]
MSVSVIFINWNTADLIVNAINSVKQTLSREHEIIVVDNASTDDSVQKIQSLFPEVKLMQNRENSGFARALNAGMRNSSGQYAIALNSDTVCLPGALDKLIDFLDAHPDAAIACPQLINADNSLQNSFDSTPSLLTETLNKSLLRLIFPEKFPSKLQARKEPFEVESCIGACMAIRKSALPEGPPLDEGFFFFLEETDLCFRVRKSGRKVFLVPMSRVIHLQGQSAGKIKIRSRIEYHRSLYRFFFKHYSMPYAALLPAVKAVKALANSILNLIPNALTLFLIPSLRKKFLISSAIFAWHVFLCPDSWGIRSAGKSAFPGYKKIKTDKTVWLVRNDYANRFAQELPYIMKNRIAIKQSRVKTLYRSEIAGENFLVKTYRSPAEYVKNALKTGRGLLPALFKAPVMLLKRAFTGHKSRIELRRIIDAHSAGIDTPLPAAVSDSTIIFQFMENAANIGAFLNREISQLSPAAVHAIIRSYGRFARSLHKKGIYQDDFSPTNILVSPDKNGIFRLWLVDFERAEFNGAPLPEKLCVLNLAKLNRMASISNTDRLRFLKAYFSDDEYGIVRLRKFIGEIAEKQKELLWRDIAKVRRQCAKPGRNYQKLDFNGFHGLLKKELPGLDYATVEKFLEKTCEVMAGRKPDGNWTLLEPLNAEKNNETYLFLAWYSDAREIWRNANALSFAGLPAVIPVALLMPENFSKSGIIAVLTESGMRQMKECLKSGHDTGQRELLTRTGAIMGRLHAMGFKADGIEAGAALTKEYGKRTAVFLPLMKNLTLFRSLTPSFRGDDLFEFRRMFDKARLTKTDKWRFLESYACHAGITPEERNELCRAMGII